MRKLQGAALLLVMTACGSGSSPAPAASSSATPDAGPPPGYVRYTTASVTVMPATSPQYVQWVSAPFDHDVDIVDIQGAQSLGGHHAVLYSMQEVQPVGTTRAWQDSDIVSAHFLGGIGGEGAAALKLPEGAVFRVRKGQALALQTHYLNTGDHDLQGSSELDVKFADPSPADVVAGMMTNTALSFQVQPHDTAHASASCTLPQDVQLLMYTNHMHQWGVTSTTSVADATGTTTPLKTDPAWNPEWATSPDFTKFTVPAPQVLHAGETLTTTCDWNNDTDQALTFPAEMCVFISFYIGDSDIGCVDGMWVAM